MELQEQHASAACAQRGPDGHLFVPPWACDEALHLAQAIKNTQATAPSSTLEWTEEWRIVEGNRMRKVFWVD
jgi:hypothetical protein